MDYQESKIEIEYVEREREIEDVLSTEIELSSGIYQGLRFFYKKFDPSIFDDDISFDYSISHVPDRMSGMPERYDYVIKFVLEHIINEQIKKQKDLNVRN